MREKIFQDHLPPSNPNPRTAAGGLHLFNRYAFRMTKQKQSSQMGKILGECERSDSFPMSKGEKAH